MGGGGWGSGCGVGVSRLIGVGMWRGCLILIRMRWVRLIRVRVGLLMRRRILMRGFSGSSA